MPRLRRDAIARMNAGAAVNSYWDEENNWVPFTAPIGGPFAPSDAAYIVRSPHADLTNERTLLFGSGLAVSDDAGPPATLTISADGTALTHPQVMSRVAWGF